VGRRGETARAQAAVSTGSGLAIRPETSSGAGLRLSGSAELAMGLLSKGTTAAVVLWKVAHRSESKLESVAAGGTVPERGQVTAEVLTKTQACAHSSYDEAAAPDRTWSPYSTDPQVGSKMAEMVATAVSSLGMVAGSALCPKSVAVGPRAELRYGGR
jgi:hypothetical protein